jgi:uncharacterized membrane protein (DUF485 family)
MKTPERGTVASSTAVHDAKIHQLNSDIWERVAGMNEFRELLRQKKRFVVPATIFFVVYYFALPISVGYFPETMSQKVLGPVNLAYLFALSQFFMAWAIAWAYIRAARKFDSAGSRIVDQLNSHRRDDPQPEALR